MAITIHDTDYMDQSLGMAYRFLNRETALQSMHNHNYYEYFVIVSGEIIHEVNNEVQYLHSGDLVLVRPNDYHRYNTEKTSGCNIINVSFKKEHFESIKNYFNNPLIDKLITDPMPPHIYLNAQRLSSLKRKHNTLNLYSEKSDLTVWLKNLLADVFSYFLIEYDRQSQSDSKKLLQPALLQMNTPENIEEGLPALLRTSGFSHGHLCRIMKKEFNTTPIKYITDLRLQYAANLLTTTDYDILSISVRLGFSSLSYFITIFKKKYGMPPSKYRSLQSNRNSIRQNKE